MSLSKDILYNTKLISPIVIKPCVGEVVHSWEKLAVLSSVELAEAYQLIGICG